MNANPIMAANNSARSSGHDAPIATRESDELHRWPLAVAINRTIDESPSDWSTRIGLYGTWGSGKTSVLNLIERLTAENNHVVVRYKAWQVTTQEKLWAGFGAELMDALEKNQRSIGLLARLQRFAYRCGFQPKPGGIVAKLVTTGLETHGVPVPKAVADTAAKQLDELSGRLITINKRRLSQLIQLAGGNKIVVMIDDLDRSDPKLLPHILLTLRELLDWPGFVFILAFDVEVVSKIIAEYSRAYGEAAQSFLDKVVDYPVYLPDPTREQHEHLVATTFARLCPFIEPATIRSAASLLPRNPRALKLFARSLGTFKPLADRHDVGEIDWDRILHLELLRVSDQSLAVWLCHALLIDPLAVADPPAIGYEIDEDQRRATSARIREHIEQITADVPYSNRGHLAKLSEAVVTRYRMVPLEVRQYELELISRPPCFTWKEFNALKDAWTATPDDATHSAVLDIAAARGYTTRSRAAKELIGAAIRDYQGQLRLASNTRTEASKRDTLLTARATLRLLQAFAAGQFGSESTDEVISPSSIAAVLATSHQWASFTHDRLDRALREAEHEFALGLAEQCTDKIGLYDRIRPWLRDYGPDQEVMERAQLTDRILAVVEADVCHDLLAGFSRPDAIRSEALREDTPRAAWLLEAIESPLFTTYRNEMLAALDQAGASSETTRNAFAYLQLVLYELRRESWVRGDRAIYIQARAPFVVAAWRSTCAYPSQYRAHRELLGTRSRLVAAGIDADSLPIPPWLQVTAYEVAQERDGPARD